MRWTDHKTVGLQYGLTALGLHPGWAFVIVAGFYLLVGVVLWQLGVRSFKQIKPPEVSIKSAKESAALLKPEGRAQARAEVAQP